MKSEIVKDSMDVQMSFFYGGTIFCIGALVAIASCVAFFNSHPVVGWTTAVVAVVALVYGSVLFLRLLS
jgi:hypothetical protein